MPLPHTDNLHELPAAGHHVVLDEFETNRAVDPLENLAGEFDFGLFDCPQLHAGHGTLGLGDEIDVLDRALLERNGPVRVVVADGRREIRG